MSLLSRLLERLPRVRPRTSAERAARHVEMATEANARFLEQDYAAALPLYEELCRSTNNYPRYVLWRGLSKAGIGDLLGALADYDHVLKIDASKLVRRMVRVATPEGADEFAQDYAIVAQLARAQRALLHAQRGEVGAALADCDTLLQAVPENLACLQLRANLKLHMGDLPGTLADLDTLVRLQPDTVQWLADRGVIKHQSGDFAGALADYAAVLQRQPDHRQTLLNWRTTQMKRGDWSGAREAALQALRFEPDDAAAQYDLACIAAHTDHIATAVTYLARAVELQPAFRAQARTDKDFAPIQDDPQFRALLDNER